MLKVAMGGRPQAEPGFGLGGGVDASVNLGGGESCERGNLFVPVKDFNFSHKPTQL